MKTHTIWKTITYSGTPKIPTSINISDYAQSMIDKITFPKKKETIDLVLLTPKDLGFTEWVTTEKLFNEDNLKKHGVELCPPEVGVHLRVQYADQPLGEWIRIAMIPLTASDGDPEVFYLGRNAGGLWLDGSWARPGHVWGPGRTFVFRLRKSHESLDTLSLSNLKTIYTKYKDEKTGITAKISNTKVSIKNSKGEYSFDFRNSTKETVKKVAEALLRLIEK